MGRNRGLDRIYRFVTLKKENAKMSALAVRAIKAEIDKLQKALDIIEEAPVIKRRRNKGGRPRKNAKDDKK